MARALESGYKDLSKRQQKRFGSKQEFRAQKKEYKQKNRMAGDKIQEQQQSAESPKFSTNPPTQPTKPAYENKNYGTDFVKKYSKVNNKVQNDSPNYGQQAVENAASNSNIDVTALDQRIQDRAQVGRSRSRMAGLELFGDTFAASAPDYQSGLGTQKPVEDPDLEKIQEETEEKLKD